MVDISIDNIVIVDRPEQLNTYTRNGCLICCFGVDNKVPCKHRCVPEDGLYKKVLAKRGKKFGSCDVYAYKLVESELIW